MFQDLQARKRQLVEKESSNTKNQILYYFCQCGQFAYLKLLSTHKNFLFFSNNHTILVQNSFTKLGIYLKDFAQNFLLSKAHRHF